MRGAWCLLLTAAATHGTPAVKNVPSSVYVGKEWVTVDFADGAAKPPPPIIPAEPTVHVSISAYRDELCGRTLFELFSYAKHPERVRVGIVEQFLEGDSRCVESYCELMSHGCPYKDQVVLLEMEAGEAQGPMHARSFGGKLIRDEDFCLQIDAHSRAVQDWDVKIIEEWADAGNEYGVLSTYVQRVEDLTDRDTGSNINNWREVPMMCSTVPGMYGMVRNNQATAARGLTRPLRSCFWGAGLSFAKCHMEKTVKHDPHSHGVFDGEEFSRAIRMWTHGYDIYVPSRGIIFHDYHKAQGSPKRWHSGVRHSPRHKQIDPSLAYNRLKGLLGMDGGSKEDLGEYGLGTRRTKEQYEGLCGMDLKRSPRNFQEGKGVCGKLLWVPWHDDGHGKEADHTVKDQDDVAVQSGKVHSAKIVSFHDAHPPASAFPLKAAFFFAAVIFFTFASRFSRVRGFCTPRTRTD